MTAWTWLKLVRNSVLAAALITAAQVGIGSGVGVIDWGHGLVDAGAWRDLLTWVAFVFAVGVLGGAAVGQRFFPGRVAATSGYPTSGYPTGGRLGGLRPAVRFWLRVTAAVGAGLGALAAFPLVWLPVLVARPTVDLRPQATIGQAAGAGIAVGLVLCFTALAWGAVAAGSTLAAGWVWLLALTSAALGAFNHAPSHPALAVLDAPRVIPATAWWFGPYLMVGLAAILGLAVAATAGWRGASWPGIAFSGVVGPVLVAAAYAITGWILPTIGLTVIRGDTSAARAATLVAIAVGALVSVCVAVPEVRRHRPAVLVLPPPPRPSRPVAIEPPRPLAISASPEAAYAPYVLEHTGQEAPYRREPAYYTDPVYLEPAGGYPTPAEPRRATSPVSSYTADPYSSDAFTVTAQTFDAEVFPTPPAPVYRPTPRSVPVPPAAPVAPPAPVPKPAAAPPPAPAGPVYSTVTVTKTSKVSGSAKIPAPPPVVVPDPEPVPRPTAAYVAPSRLVEQGYARPAAPTEPGHEERVYRAAAGPAAAPAAPTSSKRRDRKAARAAKGAAAAAAPTPPAQPVSPLRAGSIEGEIVSGSTSPATGSTGPSTPTSPASGTTPATPSGPGRTSPQGGRRGRKAEDKQLRKGERDHIDWISNLVSIEADAELKTSKER